MTAGLGKGPPGSNRPGDWAAHGTDGTQVELVVAAWDEGGWHWLLTLRGEELATWFWDSYVGKDSGSSWHRWRGWHR